MWYTLYASEAIVRETAEISHDHVSWSTQRLSRQVQKARINCYVSKIWSLSKNGMNIPSALLHFSGLEIRTGHKLTFWRENSKFLPDILWI